MNNMLSPLRRYLIDAGYDVDLFVLPQEPQHFAPEADSFEIETDQYQKLGWYYSSFLTFPKHRLRYILRPYTYLIAQGISPAYITKAGRIIDLFIPYGSDMYRLPHFSRIKVKNKLKTNIKRYALARSQAKGIKEAKYILMEETNDFYESFLTRLKPKGQRIKMAPPFVYVKQYENYLERYKGKSNYYNKFLSIRERSAFVIFHHARQMWKDIPDITYSKANNYLIEAFGRFVELYPDTVLIMFEYGNDILNSKELIRNLKIENNVFWMPLMPRRELMMGISLSDLVVGELAHSYFSYGVVHEALAAGKPLMHKRIDGLYTHSYPELYPMLYADSIESVYQGLVWAYNNKHEVVDMGIKGRAWLNKYVINGSVSKILTLLSECES